jgi:hypothetical protein
MQSTELPLDKVKVSGAKDSMPLCFQYKGKTYCTNLFKMQAQEGVPLSVSIMLCIERGFIPCLQQYVSDAFAEIRRQNPDGDAEAQRANIVQSVNNACSDAGYLNPVSLDNY